MALINGGGNGCPPGQHWSKGLQQCIADSPPCVPGSFYHELLKGCLPEPRNRNDAIGTSYILTSIFRPGYSLGPMFGNLLIPELERNGLSVTNTSITDDEAEITFVNRASRTLDDVGALIPKLVRLAIWAILGAVVSAIGAVGAIVAINFTTAGGVKGIMQIGENGGQIAGIVARDLGTVAEEINSGAFKKPAGGSNTILYLAIGLAILLLVTRR